jgi:hypothetical protein
MDYGQSSMGLCAPPLTTIGPLCATLSSMPLCPCWALLHPGCRLVEYLDPVRLLDGEGPYASELVKVGPYAS